MYRRNLIIIIVIAVLLFAGVLAAYFYFRPTTEQPAPTTTAPVSEQSNEGRSPEELLQTYPIHVYFSKHPESDNDPSRTFPVDRTAPSAAVGRYAVEQLIIGPTEEERRVGYFSNVKVRDEPSNCDGADFRLQVKDRIAELRFCRTFEAIGSVADGQAEQSILATLRQFDTIDEVVILSKDGECQFDLSGQNLCRQQ